MNFFKRWLRWQLSNLLSVVVCVSLIIGFGALAGTFWPTYAWGTTAIFALVIIGVSSWLG